MMMYWFYRILTAICSRLPLRWVQKLASVVGIIAWHILPSRRNAAKVNARIIGAEDPRKTAKESFKHTFMAYFETAYIRNIDDKFVERYVTCENTHHYEELVKNKQQFLFISAHIGSWDLCAPVTANAVDFKAVIVGRMSNSKSVNRIIEDLRNNSDRIVYVHQYGYIDKVKEYSQKGYVAGSLMDHIGTASDSIYAPFFGLKVQTLMGMPLLSARRKIPMLPSYLIRTKTGFKVIMSEPLWPNLDLKPKERVMDLLIRMNEEYERIIRQYPEQWYLLHRRFKRVEEDNGKISSSLYRP